MWETDSENGYLEITIDADCNHDKFMIVAEILEKKAGIVYCEKLSSIDTNYWDFMFKGTKITLHYNIFLGVTIFPSSLKEATELENLHVRELGEILFDNIA